jgi:WD40 repeat protein
LVPYPQLEQQPSLSARKKGKSPAQSSDDESDASTTSSPTIAPEPVYDPDAPELNPESYPTQTGSKELTQFPISHELLLKDHNKVLSALAMDPSGARLLSGSYDYDCKLWDFGGMDSRCKPFKSWEPAGCYYASNRAPCYDHVADVSERSMI